ncbi:hypothetical protein BX600DRAFT_460799 [Xylariales sp. PMI_506]|nr:hypothetical protein BX600DRAFT_460799 [Xylariales sp. PMI_506]
MKLYPKAAEGRLRFREPTMVKIRRRFFRLAGTNFILLQLLFLGLFCYCFGALYLQNSHTHGLTIGFVDYDAGDIGRAFRAAYASLEGDSFPTLVETSAAEYQSPVQLEAAVCDAKFWATLYIMPGASDRLQAVLSGSSPPADYDKSNIVGYVWNEVQYPTVADASIQAKILSLNSAAEVAYATGNATASLSNITDRAILSVLVSPWSIDGIDIQPTPQGSRAIYNTIVIVLVLIQEFFYLATINGIYAQLQIWHQGNPWIIILFRLMNSAAYTFVGSLCTAGSIWAFRDGWNVNGGQFAATWMLFWLFAHLNFQTLDVFTIWLPASYVPMALISWVILNVTSVLLPFELSPGFYRIGYLFPAHNVFQVLINIWSRGCNPSLHYALPIMFSWEVVGLILSGLGVYRRCHFARIAQEREKSQFKERLDIAVDFQRRLERERQEQAQHEQADALRTDSAATPDPSRVEQGTDAEDNAMRDELSRVISKEDSHIRRENMRRRMSSPIIYGPCFDLPFASKNAVTPDESVDDSP